MTNEEKQIEEIRKDIYECEPATCYFGDQCEKCPRTEIAKALYDKGYRKASDVAREVIDNVLSKIRTMIREIEKVERNGNSYFSEFNGGSKTALEIVSKDIADLKKKYESEGGE